MRVLLVKTSSLGDVLHTLVAVEEARACLGDVRFDWVVEEAFAEVPSWHPAVERVVPVAVRRWRRRPWAVARDPVFRAFRDAVRERPYDVVLDAQGLMKTAWLGLLARGPLVGLGLGSAREPLAACLVGRRIRVRRGQHAITRLRALFAAALGYAPTPEGAIDDLAPDYGIRAVPQPAERPYAVLVHGTAWPTKRLGVERWRELARAVGDRGLRVELPWGTDEERVRAERIAAGLAHATVLPRTTLTALRDRLASAAEVWTVDTGLAHLAAAVGAPTTTLFGASDPTLTAPRGRAQRVVRSTLGCSPCVSARCRLEHPVDDERGAPCMRPGSLDPEPGRPVPPTA